MEPKLRPTFPWLYVRFQVISLRKRIGPNTASISILR